MAPDPLLTPFAAPIWPKAMARVSDDARQMLEGSYVYWMLGGKTVGFIHTHRIHGAAIYGNMDPINIPQMLAYNSIYIPYMDPVG